MTIKIKHKRGTASAVASANPTPAAGELVFETDTRRFKLGDGSTAYSSLSYVTPYVTATDKLLGRSSAGAGSVEEITCTSFGRSLISSADAPAARTTLSVQPTASPAFTGAATFANTGDVVPLTVTNTGTVNSFVVNDASGDSDPFVIDAAGRIAIGATAAFSDSHKFAILGGLPSSAGVTAGFVLRVLVPSSSTNNFISCLSNIGTEAASYTVNSLEHYAAAQQSLGAGSAIGSQYGFVARDSLTGATNNFGFWSNIASGTGRWNFYANGTAQNYFGGQVTVASPLVLTGTVAGNVRQLRMQTSGSTRWEVGPGFDAESGSNVGSTLWITRWSDSGAFLGTPIAIARATGNVTLENQLTVSSGMSVTGTVLVGISTAFDSTSNIQIGAASNPGIGIARTATPSNTNSIAGINGTAYDGAAYVAGGTINWRANENWSSTNHGTDIQFRATPAGSGGALTEVLRITGGGQTLVTAGSGSSGSYKPGLAISGDDDTGVMQTTSGGANTLSLVTNSTERVRVDASGNVGVGTSPAALSQLHQAGTYPTSSNATQVIRQSGTIPSGTTNEFIGVLSAPATQAASFTLPTLRHFHANPQAFGAGSTVTDQYGFVAESSLTGATNNYGFLSAIASGTNRWNFYASGSAKNYFNGETLIGSTTDNGAYLLQVNSQIYATNATIATSDARFKTNVESLTDATSVIESLRPVAFDFIPQTDRNFATERQVGLIAQEAQAALAGTDYADSVVAQCGDHLGLAYEKLVPVLIKALQESNARIAALEERING